MQVGYTNKKSGDIYMVIDIVHNATNGREDECMYLYHKLDYPEMRYVRNMAEFEAKFERVPTDDQGYPICK